MASSEEDQETGNFLSKIYDFWNSVRPLVHSPLPTRAARSLRPPRSPIETSQLETRVTDFNDNYDKALEDIKRYEDFTTIDWVQDAILERSRMNALRTAAIENRTSWMIWLHLSYEAGQAWIVVFIVGAIIGMNAAITDIITEWLSDIKLGYCKNSWWLNQKFCCWEIEREDGSCEEWENWSRFYIINWFFYIFFATTFAAVCAHLIRSFAPYAAGSGISEIKCILAGFVMKGFLGRWTLLLKNIGLPLAIASGLSVGKEGPSVHTAACVGNVVSRLFGKYKRNKAKMREILSASCAAGVAVAFGSPIGGVLFSFEEMSSNFPMKTMWRSFFCALVATAVLQAMNPFRTGKLVMFQVTYDREWHSFEILFFIILGIFGGLYGALVTKYNLKVQTIRRKYLKDYAVAEAAVLACLTAFIGYFNIFMKVDMTETLGILFRECEEGTADYEGLCRKAETTRMIWLLLLATVFRTGFVILSYGAKIPAGIFIPSMVVGATFGRSVGIIAKSIHLAYPHFPLFATCKPDLPCVTPGMYAFLGAAAALGGIMHLTVCVVVIMFELTGALTYILPTMITLMVTKTIGDILGKGGIYPLDMLQNIPLEFLAIATVMHKDLVVMMSGQRLEEIEQILLETNYRGFPIVKDKTSMILMGYIGRAELRYAIDLYKKMNGRSNNAYCFFDGDSQNSEHLNLSKYLEIPFSVSSNTPLEIVLDLFKKLGPRAIVIETLGKLVGIVTRKDVLVYIKQLEKS
ncbi:10203_t:CDS:10 [Ambispora leptoticha]|uniref:Chloride channel protein n=1 Tax=Ambispora leptoticha TaxID=144679 RepID=A0A9N8ZG92_9GLOM|nr:10203_t:CDS:10 [Ambispora leptoticha]